MLTVLFILTAIVAARSTLIRAAIVLSTLAVAWPTLASPGKTLSLNVSNRISIPLDEATLLSGVAENRFTVLLNNYDVTPFSSASAAKLHIGLETALEAGDYIIQIRKISPDNTSKTMFEQRITLHATTTSASGEILANAFYRAQESDKDDFLGAVRTLSDAALRLQAQRATYRGSVSVSADIQYRSDSSNLVSGDNIALPNYLVEAQRHLGTTQVMFAAGHQNFSWDDQRGGNLVLDQFRRRGVSVGLKSANGSNSITVFASSSEPRISINENLVAPRNRSERSAGTTLRFSPFTTAPEKLLVSATYLDGRSVLVGTGINYTTGFFENREVAYGGESTSIAASSSWWQGALQLQFEEAFSDFDADGIAIGEGKRSDSARSYGATARSDGDWAITSDNALGLKQWRAHLRRQVVGPDYYSMGNLGLPGDLDTREIGLDASGANWQLQSAWVSATNNVDNNQTLPQQTVINRSVLLQLAPGSRNPETTLSSDLSRGQASGLTNVLRNVLGEPSLALRMNFSDRYQPLENALLTGQELDDETSDYTLTLDLVKPSTQWRFEYSMVEYDNLATLEVLGNTLLFAPASDSRNRFATVQFSYRPNDDIMISPLVQWNRFNEKDTTSAQQSLNYGMQSSVRWLDGRMTTSLNYASNVQKSTSAFDALSVQRYGNAQLDLLTTWQALLAKNNRPGVNLSLRTNWNVNRSSAQRNDARYQVLLGVQIHWLARR